MGQRARKDRRPISHATCLGWFVDILDGMRQWLLVLMAVIGCGAGEAASRSAEFLMIGDWGRDPVREPKLHAQQRQVAEGMAKVPGLPRPMAVLALGDNQYDGVASPDNPIFRSAFEDVYAAPALQVPFWAVLGNHEYSGSPIGQLLYAERRMGSARWTLPARYWSRVVDVGGGAKAKFIFLDTSVFIQKYRGRKMSDLDLQDAQAQLAWLARELSEPGMTWRIAVGHHPIWSNGLHGDSKDLAGAVLPLFRQHKVQLYLSGHDHHAEVIDRGTGEPLQIIAGNSSEVRGLKGSDASLHQGQYLGFGSLSIYGDSNAVVRMHDATGAERFSVSINPKR